MRYNVHRLVRCAASIVRAFEQRRADGQTQERLPGMTRQPFFSFPFLDDPRRAGTMAGRTMAFVDVRGSCATSPRMASMCMGRARRRAFTVAGGSRISRCSTGTGQIVAEQVVRVSTRIRPFSHRTSTQSSPSIAGSSRLMFTDDASLA